MISYSYLRHLQISLYAKSNETFLAFLTVNYSNSEFSVEKSLMDEYSFHRLYKVNRRIHRLR